MPDGDPPDRGARPDPSRPGSAGREAASRGARLHLAERLDEARRTIRLLWIGLAIAVALAVAGGLAGGLLLLSARRDAGEARATLAEQTRELAELRARLEDARQELDTIVRGRLPGIEPIRFDQVIKIEERYVRNLLFTQIRRGGEQRYEYKIVIENPSDSLLTPHVRLSLFDRVGVQLGTAKIASTYSITKADLVTLSPREVRSFTDEIELNRSGAEPRYYLLAVD